MTLMNLIYLGQLTDRVTILPKFSPSYHMVGGHTNVAMPFSEAFDLKRFYEESGIPVVEWDQVKDPTSNVLDELGCWNIWEVVQYEDPKPRRSGVTDRLGLGTPTYLPLNPIITANTFTWSTLYRRLIHQSARLGQIEARRISR